MTCAGSYGAGPTSPAAAARKLLDAKGESITPNQLIGVLNALPVQPGQPDWAEGTFLAAELILKMAPQRSAQKADQLFALLEKQSSPPWQARGKIGRIRIRAGTGGDAEALAKELDVLVKSLTESNDESAVDAAYYLGETQNQQAYQSLAKLNGADYVKARDAFLARPDARDFLKSRVDQVPEDWLAFALWQRAANKKFADLFDRTATTPPIQDRFVGREFGRALFDPDPLPFGGKGANRFPRAYSFSVKDEELAKRFDWMEEFAVEMEWIIRNPKEHSLCSQFWLLYAFCWGGFHVVPIAKDDLRYSIWLSVKHDRSIAKRSYNTLDPDRMKSWLAYARDHEREPIMRLLTAFRLPGKESAAVLEELSREDSLLGTLAAFFYAGQWRPQPGWSLSGGHPFNGPWLEQWSRRATPNQVQAAQWIFANEDWKRRPDVNTDPNYYSGFCFPLLAVGPLIEHHPTLVGDEMKRRYHQSVEGALKTFTRVLEGYESKQDEGGFTMKLAQEKARSSMLWPKAAAAELQKIKTSDPKAKALIAQCLSQIGQRTYPTGEDLQSMYGPEPGKREPKR